ncbi:MAG: ATP-binding protein, partial [Deltaproteobacteria bacterium]|nr:ATP-binding protein [Deltaproteobacteria bacterium]
MSLKNSKNILKSLLLGLLIFGLATPVTWGQDKNILQSASLGQSEEYTRLVFSFKEPLTDVIVRRDDVNSLFLDFGEAQVDPNIPIPHNSLVQDIIFELDGQRLTAHIILATNRFESRDFLSRDNFSLVLDFKSLALNATDPEATPRDLINPS